MFNKINISYEVLTGALTILVIVLFVYVIYNLIVNKIKKTRKDIVKSTTDFKNKIDKQINKKEITVEQICGQINAMCKLCTMEFEFRGLVNYSEGGVSFINNEKFIMLYNATITAGIDMAKIIIKKVDDKIFVKMPKAEIISQSIDPESINFIGISKPLLRKDGKELSKQALIEAKKDMTENIGKDNLLKNAEKQAKLIIESMVKVVDNSKIIYTINSENIILDNLNAYDENEKAIIDKRIDFVKSIDL